VGAVECGLLDGVELHLEHIVDAAVGEAGAKVVVEEGGGAGVVVAAGDAVGREQGLAVDEARVGVEVGAAKPEARSAACRRAP